MLHRESGVPAVLAHAHWLSPHAVYLDVRGSLHGYRRDVLDRRVVRVVGVCRTSLGRQHDRGVRDPYLIAGLPLSCVLNVCEEFAGIYAVIVLHRDTYGCSVRQLRVLDEPSRECCGGHGQFKGYRLLRLGLLLEEHLGGAAAA